MTFPRSFPLVVDFAAGTGTQTKTLALPMDVRVLSVSATTSANVATSTLNIDVTIGGTSIYAAANDKPRVAVASAVAKDGTANTNFKAAATANNVAKGATVAYQAENPPGDLTGKWTSGTPTTTASTAADALAVVLSGTYASVGCTVVLEVERV